MGNCLSKCDDELFPINTPPNTSGQDKKIVSEIYRNHVDFFVCRI